MDPRIMTEGERLKTVLNEIKALLSKSGAVWTANAGDLVRWTQILAGERLWPVDVAGDLHTLCRECQSIVWDVYVIPRPKWGICGLCCKHDKKERTHYGSCKTCEKELKL